MEETIETMEELFASSAEGRAESFGIINFATPEYNGGWAAKPGYLVRGYVGVKLGCYYPGNVSRGLPPHLAAILLSDAKNGMPLAVLDGVHITSVRTGATGGLAAKYLARKDSKTVGVLGTGVQGRMQVLALKNLFEIEEVKAYSPNKVRCGEYAIEMAKVMKTAVTQCKTAREAVEGVDILITATPSLKPLVKRAWLTAGVHINAVGADGFGKKELEPGIYKNAKLVTDKVEVALEKGLFERSDVYAELGEVVSGKKRGRASDTELTVFDSTGIGMQDVAAARVVYEKAKKKGIGQLANFI